MMKNRLNLMMVATVLLCTVVVGCTQRQSWTPRRNDQVEFAPDPANPSNVVVTISFLNPEETSQKPIVINYHSAFLQRRLPGTGTNVFLKLSPGPASGVSMCSFTIPGNEVINCRVSLCGVDSKPVGEAEIERIIELGGPDSPAPSAAGAP